MPAKHEAHLQVLAVRVSVLQADVSLCGCVYMCVSLCVHVYTVRVCACVSIADPRGGGTITMPPFVNPTTDFLCTLLHKSL